MTNQLTWRASFTSRGDQGNRSQASGFGTAAEMKLLTPNAP